MGNGNAVEFVPPNGTRLGAEVSRSVVDSSNIVRKHKAALCQEAG